MGKAILIKARGPYGRWEWAWRTPSGRVYLTGISTKRFAMPGDRSLPLGAVHLGGGWYLNLRTGVISRGRKQKKFLTLQQWREKLKARR